MNWVRIAVGIKSDPSVHAIAAACCKNDIAKAVGHVVNVLTEMPEHAREGALTGISDLTIEEWAVWRGKSGAFAKAFRAHLCRDETVRGWEKHNGAAVRESDAARERMKAKRDAEREAKSPPSTPEPTGKRSPNRSPNKKGTFPTDGTGRDVTAADAAVREAAAAAGLAEQFPDPRQQAAYRAARTAHRFPDALDDMLRGMAQGLGAPRGKPLTWHQLGQAILELRAAQRDLSAVAMGAFAANVPAEPITPKLELVQPDAPGTVRDADGALLWCPGWPPHARPTDDEISANGWSVAA